MKNQKLGIENLLSNPKLLKLLKKKRVGVVCHPASVNADLEHSVDLLAKRVDLRCAFGPQHGVRGDKQDNMVETDDFNDPKSGIPVFSLYGQTRRPTAESMEKFDVLIFDLQDLGCRIYTFITTLLYVMEACAQHRKSLIVLDRPNPAGRPVEGLRLREGWESFVGASPIPMRHGLTVGELALYYRKKFKLDVALTVVPMKGYKPDREPLFGALPDRAWINPSPNIPTLNSARAFPGTVLIEGTTLSEGRGTTRALEVVGAPDLDVSELLKRMKAKAPKWLKGAVLRECHFEPTFHKHQGKLCHGFQFHTDLPKYRHGEFRPYRVVSLFLKTILETNPSYPLFRDFAYEYVTGKLAFDVIAGGTELRNWIQTPGSTPAELDALLQADEKSWLKERREFLLY